MKKYIIGAFIGFVLATAASAKAEGVSRLIDQVVQGVFPVTVDGNSVGDAIVVDNKTYLPVREFGEATGYKVTFSEDREVILTKSGAAETPAPTSVPAQSVKTTQEQIAELRAKIEEQKNLIQSEKNILAVNKNLATIPGYSQENYKKAEDNYNRNVSEAEKRIAEYEAQIAAIEN